MNVLTACYACIAATLPIAFRYLLLQLVQVRGWRHSCGFDCKPCKLLRGIPVQSNPLCSYLEIAELSSTILDKIVQAERTDSSRRPSPYFSWLSCVPVPSDACLPGLSMLLHTGTIGRP